MTFAVPYPAKQFLNRHAPPKVAILLCTHQGQHFLADQLASFEAQTHKNWTAWVSDDVSTDGTWLILTQYQAKWGDRLSLHSGPKEGFVSNFLSLTCKIAIDADYYAYSDQDDVWEPDKLQRALSWLRSVPDEIPALYCSRTRIVDTNNREIGLSPLFPRKPCFANALMQNIGGGNTMVFNAAARTLICQAGAEIDVPSHDWWAYIIVSGCGGKVFYDDYPSLRYRQHEGNLVGANSSWSARFARIQMLWKGRFKDWNEAHIQALRKIETLLTPENIVILRNFSAARNKSWISRLFYLHKSGVYRQSLPSNLGLVLATLLGKI